MSKMMELCEARKNLDLALDEETRKQYISLLRQWFSFESPLTKTQFNGAVRKLLSNQEQIRRHNAFLLVLLSTLHSTNLRSNRSTSEKGIFEIALYTDFVQPSSPLMMSQAEFENRSAAAELFVPDNAFVATRITIHAWENNLERAEDKVTEMMVHLIQTFIKNIITAMASRLEGYKIKDQKFQHGFGLPVPDPFVKNAANIIDFTQESNVDIDDEDDNFKPAYRPSAECAEQQLAFGYSCGKTKVYDRRLTVKLLYDTIRENPGVIGVHSVHSVNLLKMGLQLEP